MSRIRSVHPGLWTDERFVAVSSLSRLLFIGIWNECDDTGSFEWSPLKLKMRLLPADNADVSALLEELHAEGCVIRYEIDGRKFGAVRNFTRYQRPKKPNSIYPQTDEVRKFCSGNAKPVPNQLPTASENLPQREEGGGRREDSEEPDGSPAPEGAAAQAAVEELPLSTPPMPDPAKVMFDSGLRLFAAQGVTEARARPQLGKWKSKHGAEAVIIALGAAQREGAIDLTSFIERCLRNGPGNRSSGTGQYGSGFRDPVLADIVAGSGS